MRDGVKSGLGISIFPNLTGFKAIVSQRWSSSRP